MLVLSNQSEQDIERARAALEQVRAEVTGQGMAAIMALAVVQMQRFVTANIEVDTGRTKNSIFTQVRVEGNGVDGVLGTNVSYAPYVRDDGHYQQFFEFAAEAEGPRVAQLFGDEVQIRVQRAGG